MSRPDPLLLLQGLLALVGATAFCLYSHSWVDATHLLYDIPAGLATFGFIAQLVIELPREGVSRFGLYRAVLVIAMTAVTVGRRYLGWPISGHLSCVLAIALVQSLDRRLSFRERLAYWMPIPIVFYLRLVILEHDGHVGIILAVLFALVWGVPGMILASKVRRVFPGEPPPNKNPE
jgi:hypothetical protein